jgi:hypothetical protein
MIVLATFSSNLPDRQTFKVPFQTIKYFGKKNIWSWDLKEPENKTDSDGENQQ